MSSCHVGVRPLPFADALEELFQREFLGIFTRSLERFLELLRELVGEIAGFPAADTLAERAEGGDYGTPRFVGLGGAYSVLYPVQELFVLHEPLLSPLIAWQLWVKFPTFLQRYKPLLAKGPEVP